MPFKIAIASGKGGTGKTTVAVNIYQKFALMDQDVVLLDCDVEEPNSALFFPDKQWVQTEDIHQLVPKIDENKCTFCGKCSEWCEFNAIAIIPSKHFASVDSSLCHSCGACSMACEFNAIVEYEHAIGTVQRYRLKTGNYLYEGRLKVGSSMQTMMISELKRKVPNNEALQILDAPPGTSCQVVETISDCDYVVLVTEPTPFGLHDLKLMVQLARQMKKPFGVVINKAGMGDDKVYEYLRSENIELLSEIPFDKTYASNYAKGQLLSNQPTKVSEGIDKLLSKLQALKSCEKLPY